MTQQCRTQVTLERTTDDVDDKGWKVTGITIVPCWIKGNKNIFAD